MSLTTTDDRPRVPRVHAKVFADLPTQVEVQAAKRGRAQWIIIGLIAIGAAVALGLAMAYFANKAAGIPKMETAHQTEIDRLNDKIHDLETDNASLVQYRPIADLRRQGDDHRTAIRRMLAEKTFVHLKSDQQHDVDVPAWDSVNTGATKLLQDQVDRLAVIEQQVHDARPPTPLPAPRTPDSP